MTVTPPAGPPGAQVIPDRRIVPVLRQIAGMLLLIAGIGYLLWWGFTQSVEDGVAVLSCLAVATGLALGASSR